jgi:hypothetical protein
MLSVCIPLHGRSSSYPFLSGDTFREISNHIVDETNMPFNPHSVKNGDVIFLKTDMAREFFSYLHPKIDAKYILITHNSDLAPIGLTAVDHPPTTFTLEKYLDDPKIIVWFAQNIDREHPKLKAIPIGIANSCWKHGNITILNKAMEQIPLLNERNESIYINCTSSPHLKERLHALECLKKKSFCYHVGYKNFSSYLEEIKQFKFVLSPPGNGFDCHRTWEALLMGCIPIVKHSLLDSLYQDLPIILVNDWNEVTPTSLNSELTKIASRSLKQEKMYAQYWIDLIKSYQKSYQNDQLS